MEASISRGTANVNLERDCPIVPRVGPIFSRR
jgi:hypothetical protein